MRPRRRRTFLVFQFLLIVGAACFVYSPVFHGSWHWDDNVDILQNRLLHDPAGLWKIWFASDNVDYFPLKATANWIQWRLWGADPFGYHLTNVALHTLSALLFWRLLHRIGLKGAWWGGLLFAVHPLAVESVAWIAELKNTLSLALLLPAMICYIDFDDSRTGGTRCPERAERRRQPNQRFGDSAFAWLRRTSPPSPSFGGLRNALHPYFWSLGLFLAAMLAKTSVAMFPFVILLFAWWRHGRISRGDLLASSPFFALSLFLGSVTIWFQSHGTDVGAAAASSGPWQRLMEAGQGLGFYAIKCVWPVDLAPLYPRWPMRPADVWPLSILALAAAGTGWLWTKRKTWGRPVLFGLGFFAFNLAPVLGFIPMSFRRYSLVSDHLAYVSLLGIIGLAVAAGGFLDEWISPRYRHLAAVGALGICGLLASQSRNYARNFLNGESLWTYALRHNPDAWVAHINLGVALASAGRNPEAIAQFQRALQLKPDEPNAHFSLGNALRDTGRWPEAIVQYEEALRFRPIYPEAHNNLASVLADADRLPEAIAHFEAALRLDPSNAEVRNNFGNALRKAGRGKEAVGQYEQALLLDPNLPAAHFNLALSLSDAGNWPEAIVQLEWTLKLQPDFRDAEDDLGIALADTGRLAEAVSHFTRAVLLQPESAAAQHDLGATLDALGRTGEAQVHLAEAARLEATGHQGPH